MGSPYSHRMPEGPRNLRADTVLTRDPAIRGRFHADIPDGWKVVYVFGGVSMYTALRAMQEALGRPELALVTANAIFVAPVPPGPVTIDVEVLRDGRSASQVAADLRVGGRLALRAHGVFGVAHDTDLGFLDVQFPDVPGPLEIDAPAPPPGVRRGPIENINFHEQTDWRPLDGSRPGIPTSKPAPRIKVWTRLQCEPQLPDGSYDLLTLAVHGDVIGPAVGQGLGPIDSRSWCCRSRSASASSRHRSRRGCCRRSRRGTSATATRPAPRASGTKHGNLCAIATQTANLRVMSQR